MQCLCALVYERTAALTKGQHYERLESVMLYGDNT